MATHSLRDHAEQVSRALGKQVNVHQHEELVDGYRLEVSLGSGSIFHSTRIIHSYDDGRVQEE